MNKRRAAKALRLKLSEMPLGETPVYITRPAIYIDKVVVVEPTRSDSFTRGYNAGYLKGLGSHLPNINTLK